MTKIALLIPYYGEFPDYFPFYLDSLQSNKHIHLYLFTDRVFDGVLPDNCTFVQYSLKQFKESVAKKLSVNCEFDNIIKICDYRPAYGVIFEKYIHDYEYWAFGDIDVIYGDVISALPGDWYTYDAISMLSDWVSGSLFLLKNTKKVNNLFMKSKAWKTVFNTPDHFAFDECNHLYNQIRSGQSILDIDENESFTFILKSESNQGNINVWFKNDLIIEDVKSRANTILYKNNKIYQIDGKEYAYYHLICQKGDPGFHMPNWEAMPDIYYIYKNGIVTEQQYNNPLYKLLLSVTGFVSRSIYYIAKVHKIPSKILGS